MSTIYRPGVQSIKLRIEVDKGVDGNSVSELVFNSEHPGHHTTQLAYAALYTLMELCGKVPP